METTIGQYTAHFSAIPLLSGSFLGLATLVRDESDARIRQTREFFDEFATAAEATNHAREQTLRRLQRTVAFD